MKASEHVLDHVNRGFTPVNVHLAVFLATFSPSVLAHNGLVLTALPASPHSAVRFCSAPFGLFPAESPADPISARARGDVCAVLGQKYHVVARPAEQGLFLTVGLIAID
jgi:hypothetical protein